MNLRRLDPRDLKPHPVHAEVYADGADEGLIESVRERGVLVPLVAVPVNGHYRLIAGHRRREAAIKAGLSAVDVRIRDFDSKLDEGIAVIESNRQRVKTLAQLLREGEYLERVFSQEAAERQRQGKGDDGSGGRGKRKTSSAKDLKVSAPQTRDRVSKSVGLGSGTTWDRLKAVAKAKPEALDTIDRRVIGKEWRELNRQKKIQRLAEPAPLVGPKRYVLIYADPPWRYEHAESSNREIENQYPTMTLESIKELPISKIARDDAVLFLWATAPKLEEALEVMRTWSFRYRTCLVWVKDRIGMGYYARQRHELLLVGTRGKIPPPRERDRPDSVIEAPRCTHSQKPDLYVMLERMYPKVPSIELFARQKRDGWDSWGQEA